MGFSQGSSQRSLQKFVFDVVFHRVRFTDLGPQKQESTQKQSFGENLSMRSSADATEERARTRTDGEESRLAQFKEGWEQMCCSCANQEHMCAHVGLFAESLIKLLGNPELEGLKLIAPELEKIVRLQMDVMRSIEKSSSIITEINGIVSGEAGERNPAVQTTVNRKRGGRSPAAKRTTTTPKSARRGRGRGNGDHGAVKRRGAENKNQTDNGAAGETDEDEDEDGTAGGRDAAPAPAAPAAAANAADAVDVAGGAAAPAPAPAANVAAAAAAPFPRPGVEASSCATVLGMLPLRRYNVDNEFVRSRTPKGSVCRDDPNGLPQYWCLERILDSRVQCGFSDDGVMAAQQKEYLCKWFGYGEDHSSWEPEAALSECTLHVHKYENRHSVAAPAATQLPGTPYHSLAGPSAIGDDVQMEDARAATDTTTADAGAVRLHDLAGEADRAATDGGADETAAAYGAPALESASASSQPHLSFEAPSDESLLPPLQALSGPADEALEETAATDDEAATTPPEKPPPPPPCALSPGVVLTSAPEMSSGLSHISGLPPPPEAVAAVSPLHEAGANATVISGAMTAAAVMAPAAMVASSAEVAAAGARLNWKRNMMERIAAGAIRKVVADQLCKVPRKVLESEDQSRSFFASNSDLWEALGVPQDFRPSASKNLVGIFWKVGQEIPGSTWVSPRLHARFRDAPEAEAKHRWFAVSEVALAKLEEVVASPEATGTNWQTRASRALMNPESLRTASASGLNCEICNMPILDPDAPHFAERAIAIAHLCHSDGNQETLNAIAHLCQSD